VDHYTRRQLVLLLVVVLVAGAGIAVDRWRRTHPEIADRLEAFDRTAPPEMSRPQPSARQAPRRAPDTHASAPTPPLDLNRATPDDLLQLPGIGPGLAARIVDTRARDGAFGSIDELRRVRGIGRTTLERLRPLLAVGPAP
jgi:competence ComEA-like helix-hairpin-helix protein